MFDEPIFGWKGVPQGYYVDEYAAEGIMLEGAHGPPALMGASIPGVGRTYKERLSDISNYADFGVMVSDSGAGRVRLGPRGEPIMIYSMNNEDTRRMVKGMALTASIFLAAGAKEIFTSVWRYSELYSPREVQKFRETRFKPSDMQSAAFHPLGTCRMGEDPARSVVNSYLKCHDLDNLYVVDGSPFPTSLGVNPQETIMAFAHRTAEHIANTDFKK
jgi:choline dehydrogenase-like flavoprotein